SDTWIIMRTIFPSWIWVLMVYGVVLAASIWISCLLVPDALATHKNLAGTLVPLVALQLGALSWGKQYSGLQSYFSWPELNQPSTALGLACLLSLGWFGLSHRGWPSPNWMLLDALLSFCALSGLRLLLRHWRERAGSGRTGLDSMPVRVGIIGAGHAGSQLALELMAKR